MQTMDIGCKGNLFLNKLVGSQIIVVPQLQYKSGLKQMMEKISEKLYVKGQRTVKPRELAPLICVAVILQWNWLCINLLVTGLDVGIDLTGRTCLKGLKKLHEFTAMLGTF